MLSLFSPIINYTSLPLCYLCYVEITFCNYIFTRLFLEVRECTYLCSLRDIIKYEQRFDEIYRKANNVAFNFVGR